MNLDTVNKIGMNLLHNENFEKNNEQFLYKECFQIGYALSLRFTISDALGLIIFKQVYENEN